jgi:hypothetical protein
MSAPYAGLIPGASRCHLRCNRGWAVTHQRRRASRGGRAVRSQRGGAKATSRPAHSGSDRPRDRKPAVPTAYGASRPGYPGRALSDRWSLRAPSPLHPGVSASLQHSVEMLAVVFLDPAIGVHVRRQPSRDLLTVLGEVVHAALPAVKEIGQGVRQLLVSDLRRVVRNIRRERWTAR